MTLRSALRVPARMAAKAALPYLVRSARSGELGKVGQEIATSMRRSLAPRIDLERFPDGQLEQTATDTVRFLRILWSNKELLERTMLLLEDDESRRLLRRILAYRALGPRHVRLPGEADNPIELQDNARKQLVSSEKFSPFGTQLFNVDGVLIEAWLMNVWADFHEQQYVFDRGGIHIAVSEGDVVIDAGACFGDTALTFAMAIGPSGHVHAFEPMPSQVEVLLRNLNRNPKLSEHITHHAVALSDQDNETLLFADGGAAARVSENGTIEVRTRTLDSFVIEHEITPTFIKMDIEGAEIAALLGAVATLRANRPKLAISAYHSLYDLLALAPLIHSIQPSYRFYLDHHTTYEGETVLYALSD